MDKDLPPQVYSLENGFSYSNHPYGSQIARPDGPLLMQDFHHIENMAHFDRERVPERVVHAKGGGCRFEFELTDSLGDITYAAPFQEVGYKCPGVVRFSTVGREQGSSDTVRDPRGASWKFYTNWGNHDWVFNNTPVFFIRDGLQFPHFIHTQKRDPQSHLSQDDDSSIFWDYLTQNVESIHQVTYMFGPRGTPSHWGDMSSYSGHAFKFINKNNELTYVQIHVRPVNGFKCLGTEEANKLAGSNPDYNQARLFRQLQNGEKSRYNCFVQTMTPKEAEEFRYSINDLTKIWPHSQFPLRKFGEITLTENVVNFFEEIEQIAFSPTNTCIPGIEPTNDPVLQARLFSYSDTQRHRLGTNYAQLPVNRPRNAGCPYANIFSTSSKTRDQALGNFECPHTLSNFQRDGPQCLYNKGAEPNYISTLPDTAMKFKGLTSDSLSNRFTGLVLDEDTRKCLAEQETERERHEKIINSKLNEYYYKSGVSELDLEQPRVLYERVFDQETKEVFIDNLVNHVSLCLNPAIKIRVTQYFGLLNKDLGAALANRLNIEYKPLDLQGYAKAVGIASAA